MRILVYGDIGGSGGYHRYCKGIFGSGVLPSDSEIWFICSVDFYKKLGPLDPCVRVVTHEWPSSTSPFLRYLWHLWVYPRLVQKIRPDIEFFPSGTRRVYFRSATTVTSCHNLLLFDPKQHAHLVNSNDHSGLTRYHNSQAKSFAKSDGTIFTSQYSRQIVTRVVAGITKTAVIANGLDSAFLLSDERCFQFGPTITLLYVSPVFPYKHQVEVVKAVRKLRVETGMDLRLRLIGGGDPSALTALEKAIQAEGMTDFVCQLAFINHTDLIGEYRSADLFIFASDCEAFGISLLEAMGAGLPIACSDRSGLSDLLRDAGAYFDPENIESISNALLRLLADPQFRKNCGESANRIAQEYTWKRCAHETISFLNSIGGN